MMWYSWNSLASFEEWHQAAKTFLGIPYPGRNSATGQIDESAQWTTAYTEPTVLAENDVRAFVEDYVSLAIPNEIGVLCDPPPTPVDE